MAKAKAEHPELLTARLRLRQFRESDAGAMHAMLADPQAMRYWNHAPHDRMILSERAVRSWVECTPSYYRFWAVTARDSEECVGMVNYHDGHIRNKRASIGYLISPARQREGLAREAVGAMLGHMFSAMRLHRVEAYIHPDNTASQALARGLGFACEGVMREHLCVDGDWRDDMVWALLGRDFAG